MPVVHTVTVRCDRCTREAVLLRTCLACRRKTCCLCFGAVPLVPISPPVCRDCESRDDVADVCHRFLPRLTEFIEQQNEAVRALPPLT